MRSQRYEINDYAWLRLYVAQARTADLRCSAVQCALILPIHPASGATCSPAPGSRVLEQASESGKICFLCQCGRRGAVKAREAGASALGIEAESGGMQDARITCT